MRTRVPLSIIEVSERQLCTGCGACASVEPDRFRMGDALAYGRRPFIKDESISETGEALSVCPGIGLRHTLNSQASDLRTDLWDAWGPVYEVWEGHAVDPAIRYAGSSGGAATAIALFAIQSRGMAGALHTGADQQRPYLNSTVYSTSREQLLSRTGSRYAPASPCDSLNIIEQQHNQSVFIGKPCDVAAVQNARKIRPVLDAKIGLTIAFFCAGSPSTQGTLDLLRAAGVEDVNAVTSLRYRGNGWPGNWIAEWVDSEGTLKRSSLTYAESWHFLQRYRQWRCYICPDHTGEFADIAVGDPWYREIRSGEHGSSLIVARTAHGRDIIREASEAGYIKLNTRDASLLARSQPNLLETRGALWARLCVLRWFGASVPVYKGFATFSFWISKLSFRSKLRSFTGTATRIMRRRLRDRVEVTEHHIKNRYTE